jgi:uncharacterized protein (TIGR03435 family)
LVDASIIDNSPAGANPCDTGQFEISWLSIARFRPERLQVLTGALAVSTSSTRIEVHMTALTKDARRASRTLLLAVVTAVALAGSTPGAQDRTPPAQTPAATAPGPAFEVASIKQNKSVGEMRNWQAPPSGRFTATNMPLRALIRLAYGSDTLLLPNEQIVGGPGWIDSDRFDIVAKAAGEVGPDAASARRQLFAMLRTLLEDRFKLKAHMESRELPIFFLVMAKKDGTLGPQLTRSTLDCRPGAPDTQGPKRRCGISSPGPGVLVAGGIPISLLVGFLQLSPAVARIVRDHTGLTGAFDFRIEYVPPLLLGANPGSLVANPAADSGPTLPTALQEQLGLKLEPAKGPVDVLVIDHVEALTPDK